MLLYDLIILQLYKYQDLHKVNKTQYQSDN